MEIPDGIPSIICLWILFGFLISVLKTLLFLLLSSRHIYSRILIVLRRQFTEQAKKARLETGGILQTKNHWVIFSLPRNWHVTLMVFAQVFICIRTVTAGIVIFTLDLSGISISPFITMHGMIQITNRLQHGNTGLSGVRVFGGISYLVPMAMERVMQHGKII